MALYFMRRINKNALFTLLYLAILRTGITLLRMDRMYMGL